MNKTLMVEICLSLLFTFLLMGSIPIGIPHEHTVTKEIRDKEITEGLWEDDYLFVFNSWSGDQICVDYDTFCRYDVGDNYTYTITRADDTRPIIKRLLAKYHL